MAQSRQRKYAICIIPQSRLTWPCQLLHDTQFFAELYLREHAMVQSTLARARESIVSLWLMDRLRKFIYVVLDKSKPDEIAEFAPSSLVMQDFSSTRTLPAMIGLPRVLASGLESNQAFERSPTCHQRNC